MDNLFEEAIKQVLHEQVDQLEVSEGLYTKINRGIARHKKERFPMKNYRKLIVVGALCLSLTATIAFAGSKITSFQSASSSQASFEQYPTVQQVKKAVDFTPKYVKAFSNGFQFKEASVGQQEGTDEQGNVLAASKFINFFYDRADSAKGQYISLNVNKVIDPALLEAEKATDQTEVRGLKLSYDLQMYKFVPEDYQLTEADKAAEADGSLMISVGTQEVELHQMQSVVWTENGLQYTLLNSDYNDLTRADMLKMAEEVLAQ